MMDETPELPRPLPVPAPMPVATTTTAVAPLPALPYSTPMNEAARPGVLTAIGVISIVVACLSAMVSLGTGCQAAGYFMASKMSRAMAGSTATTTSMTTTTTGTSTSVVIGIPPPAPPTAVVAAPATSPAPAPLPTGDHGLSPADRQVAASVLGELQPLSAERARQLDALLAEQGLRAFPTGGAPLTPSRVRTAVTRSSAKPASADGDAPGANIYVTSWGTLKVFDDKAVFAPAGNGGEVEVAAPIAADDPSGAINPAAAPSAALTPAEVQAAVARVQAVVGNKLTPAQVAGLTATLSDPHQQLIPAGMAWSPVNSASVGADGSAFVQFGGGFASVSPQGQVNSNPFAAMGMFNVSATACVLTGVDAVLSIALAIFLFIAGLNVLRQAPAGGRLHKIFAVLKIPLVLFGGASMAWMNYQLYSSMPGLTGGASANPAAFMALFWALGVAVPGLIYPIALLITLRTRGIREYYAMVRG